MGLLFPCSRLLWDLGQITQQVSRFFLCKMRDKNHMLSVQDSREGELTFFLLFCLLHDFKRETAKTSCYFYLSHGRHNVHLSIFPNWMRQQNIAWRIKHSYIYYILCEMTGYFGNWMGWKIKETMSPYCFSTWFQTPLIRLNHWFAFYFSKSGKGKKVNRNSRINQFISTYKRRNKMKASQTETRTSVQASNTLKIYRNILEKLLSEINQMVQ